MMTALTASTLGDPTDEAAPDEMPLERLESELVSFAAHLAAGEAQWLAWLAAYDRRKGWESWGCRSAAAWLSWKCAMSLPAGHERVRVAHALEALPLTSAAFARGELSYSKVRAITRAATPYSEVDLIGIARSSTAAQLDRICGGIDRAREDPPGEVPAVAKRYLSARRNDDGTTTVTLRILDDTADAVVAAVNAKVDEIVRDGADGPGGLTRSEVIEHRGGRAALRALALTLAIVEGVDTTVMFTVAADAAPADTAPTNTEPISTEPVTRFGPVVERLACDCRVNLTLTDANRKPLSVGRETRVVPRSIRTALAVRDNEMCRFPGCGSTRGLHAHHVIHWLNGGPTELDNLILVCSFHHHVIHDGGSEVERRDVGFRFLTPAGDEATIEHSRGSLHDLYWYTRQQVGEFTRLEPDCYDRIQDLSWITASILHNEEYRRHRDN